MRPTEDTWIVTKTFYPESTASANSILWGETLLCEVGLVEVKNPNPNVAYSV